MRQQDLDNGIQRFASLKQDCKQGSKIAEVIDDDDEIIARKVAVQMVQ